MKDTIKIGDHIIGSGRAFVIAEIGNNHNGSFDRAIQMIDQAVEMQADCVKFQMRHLDQLYRKKSIKKSGEDLGTEYVLDLLRKFELTVGEQEKLSLLTHTHRGKIKNLFLGNVSKKEGQHLSRMIALIRISVLLKYTEEPSGTLNLELTAKNSTLTLLFQNNWLDAHPLTRQAIDKEKILLADVGITLQTSG